MKIDWEKKAFGLEERIAALKIIQESVIRDLRAYQSQLDVANRALPSSNSLKTNEDDNNG